MKFIFTISALFVLAPMSALAMECSSGSLGDDSYLKVSFNEASTEFQAHEASFKVLNNQTQTDGYGNYMIIPNKAVKLSAEGEQSTAKVFAILLFKGTEVTIYLKVDGDVYHKNTVLKCLQ